jgi:hypothetical protein
MNALINPPESITHRLPLELLDQIIEHVQDKSDLARLSTTCKRLHIYARRILYNTITLKVYTKPHTIYLLLRSLFRNPALPPLVKHFTIQRGGPANLDGPYVPVLDPAIRVLLEHALEPEYLKGKAWFQNVIDGDPLAAAAFIMWMLPELKTLKIDESVLGNAIVTAFWHILRAERFIVTPITTFRWDHLESFDVGLNNSIPFPFGYSVFLLMQRCARLKSAKIPLSWGMEWHFEPSGDTYTLPFLSKLVLSYVHHRRRVNRVGEFLMAVPNLKTFDYTYELDLKEMVFSQEALVRSLFYVKSTLEHLRINLKRYLRYDKSLPASHIIRGKLVGLQDFSSLVSLEIWATVLLGCPDFSRGPPNLGALLPRNLKKLHLAEQLSETDQLRWFDKDYAELLRVFLSSWHEYTPDLEVLILEITTENEEVEGQRVWKLLNEHSLEWKWRRITPGFEYTVNLRRETIS